MRLRHWSALAGAMSIFCALGAPAVAVADDPISYIGPITLPGGPSYGKISVTPSAPLPIYCVVYNSSVCGGGGGGGNTGFAPVEASGTVATGGTFQTVFASNSSRVNCFIQNPTSATVPLFVHWTTATATTNNSATLAPGSSFSCAGNGVVVTTAVQVTATDTGHAFIANGA